MRTFTFHGHFYQPNRDDPWTGAIPYQSAAAPFNNWSERIASECYAPVASSGLLELISFNFGPTLLDFLEVADKKTYLKILEADRISVKQRGSGNAIAQGYNHTILPLNNNTDRKLQIRWGIEDFKERFQRRPEGFWLPECAVNSACLEDLWSSGIKFVILSPYQAKAIRSPDGQWIDVHNAQFDPTRPYRVKLGNGRYINVFFYDGPISQRLAFDNISSTKDLLSVFKQGFAPRDHEENLVVAIDGETLGHHKKGLETLLYQSLQRLMCDGIEGVNFGQILNRTLVDWEVALHENSSWSCCHGIERWKSNCGCGRENGESQQWRGQLRSAFDWLRDQVLALDLPLSQEIQKCLQLMYTSCGWFFSSLKRSEPQQNIAYAYRACELIHQNHEVNLTSGLRSRLP